MDGQRHWVLKFGGTSLETPRRVESAAAIIRERVGAGPAAVVVSAFGGVTDALADAAAAASRGDASHRECLEAIAERHRRAAEELAPAAERDELLAFVDRCVVELDDLLRGVSLVRECSARTLDSVLSYGEVLSSVLVAAALRRAGVDAQACDARRFVVTDSSFGAARVDWQETRSRIREHFARVGAAGPLQVVTGFLGCTPSGETTTLGRGGSDYTAALVGAALDAEAIEIWTDVDGVMSADPRLVANAFSLPVLSYVELQELSHFGAKVVYPPAVHPARERSIPLVIRNTLNPSFPGTRVVDCAPAREGHPVRGISSIVRVALLRVEGDGLAGMRDAAHRLFGALARGGIQPLLITQASSGHSICFAVPPAQVARASRCVEEEFDLERRAGLVDELVVEPDCSVIAAVGEGMRETPGVAARLFGALGRSGVNVRAIAQGSSELNISVVVAERDHGRAVQAIHDAFFAPGAGPAAPAVESGAAVTVRGEPGSRRRALAATERIPVAVLGATGAVGQRFVSLLAAHPWFEVTTLTASDRSAGKSYGEAVRWLQAETMPPGIAAMGVLPTEARHVEPRLVFSALDAAVAGPVEAELAARGHVVVSNARSHRMDPQVPLLVPEVNAGHLELVGRRPAGAGAIIANPNCSTIGLTLALKPLADAFGLEGVHVVTLQAVSGAGYPGVPSLEMVDNVVPFIAGEEEKLESETLKVLGRLEATADGCRVVPARLHVSAQCNRVPVLDGHLECVSVALGRQALAEELWEAWARFEGPPEVRELPSAPARPVHYVDGHDRPQPRLDRARDKGMAVAVGRLRPCPILDYKFVLVTHNTLRGAAGGGILCAELAVARGLV